MLTSRERKLEKSDLLDLGVKPNLHFSIRNLLIDKITNHITYDAPSVKVLSKKIRSRLQIYNTNKRESFQGVAGADAGSQVLPLASRRYAVISALVYQLPSGERFFLEPESFYFSYTTQSGYLRGILNIRREAKLFETAFDFIREFPRTQLIMIDGPLAFSNWWNIAGEQNDRRRLIDAIKRFLDICRDEDVTVAGLVKRPSARYLIYNLGLDEETELSDSYVLLHTLNPGERTDIFSPRASIQKVMKNSYFLDAFGHPIYSFYIRLSQDWSIQPARIDLPAFSLGHLNDVADYCYCSSVWKGIPLPIVRADEEVKISKSFIGEVYRDIVNKIGRLNGDVSHLAPYWGEETWMGV